MPDQFPNTEPLARNTDPETSHRAGIRYTESGKRDTWKKRILDWLRDHNVYDERGVTPHELALISDFPHPACHKRLPDLKRDGYVTKTIQRQCQITHELAWAWRALTPEELATGKVNTNQSH